MMETWIEVTEPCPQCDGTGRLDKDAEAETPAPLGDDACKTCGSGLPGEVRRRLTLAELREALNE